MRLQLPNISKTHMAIGDKKKKEKQKKINYTIKVAIVIPYSWTKIVESEEKISIQQLDYEENFDLATRLIEFQTPAILDRMIWKKKSNSNIY